MTRPVITLGDKTDHGGTVTSAAPTTTTGGKAIARVGDTATCPRCHKSSVRIVSGDATTIIDGQPVARDGDKTECGATLIANQHATATG